MVKNNRLSIFVIFLVIVMCLSLTNVQSAFADDNTPPTSAPVLTTEEAVTEVPVIATEETPTEEPVIPTDIPTQTPVEATPLTVEVDAQPPVDEATISDILMEAPANTDVIVLDENGNPVNLASQEAANILEEADPIWCPASVLIPTAGANGCTTNQTITGLLALMRANAGNAFSQDGKIFLEKPNGAGFTTSLIFDNSVGSLGTSFNTLKNFNIFVIGGWNGGATTTLSGNTNFGNNAVVRFGSSGAGNSWVGNITLQDINVNNNQSANTSVQVFGSIGSVTLNDVDTSNGQGNTALSITTSSGNVSLDNVDVSNQDTGNTGVITSTSGNITISNNSSFNGNGNNLGFSATTTSGTISISDTTFSDAQGNGTGTNRNGATLSAPTVTLTNVDTQNNDLNGIAINNANTVNLNNVTADGNGTNPPGPNNSLGSGVLVNGTGTTIVNVTGGDFTNNERYGIEILNATVNVISQPTFSGNGMGNSNTISDSTPPTVTPTVTCATPGNNGWCRGNIQVTWTITDSESFVTNANNCGTTNVTNNTSSAGTTVTCTATTSGGTTSNSVTVYRDANAPFNVSGAPNRTPDSNGWYNHAVNIVFSGTDNNSGIASCSNIVYSGPNGTNRNVAGTCTDLAGNISAAVNSSNFNYDGALPTITAAITGGTLGTNGWYRSNVTVHFTCTDTGGSNINFGACPADQTLSAEGSSISSTAQTVTDRAGNVSAPSNIITVSIDKTRPTILAAATTSPNAAGWYNSNVTIQFTCTDGGSGIATCPTNQTLSATGSSTAQTATDVAGNTSLASNTVAVKVDKTVPTISATITSGTLGSNGWYTSNVTIHFTCADTGGSGLPVGACPADEVLSAEGSSVTSSAQAVTDTAGNASAPSNTFTVKIDKTAPSASANLSSAPNANGWHNNNVTVSFSGVDGSGSGIASCSASVNLSEGAGQSASGTCTDNAGNVSSPATASGINIDKTAPSASASASPLPNVNGWNNTNVTVTFTGNDALSGIDVCDANVVLSTEGAGQSASGTCTDKAGNVSNTANVTNINIDKTNPTITVPANITREATGASGATVTYSASASDALDNSVTVSCIPSSGSTFAIGSTPVTCSSTDQAGNTGSNSFTITVQDTTAPSVTVPANITAEATAASGATVNFSTSASDIVDGNLTPTCIPASGSTFALGTTTVTCSATDAHNNTGSNTFSVMVQDTTAPVVTVPANISKEATGPTGAIAIFSASANDLVDGVTSVSCSPVSGSTFAIGSTTVTCSSTDVHNNKGTNTFTVTVGDHTPPTLTLPTDITKEATGPTGVVVTFTTSATDIVDGTVNVTCTPASGSIFPITTTVVNCSATDTANNTASQSFNVTVQDTTAPIISSAANILSQTIHLIGGFVTYTIPGTTDIVDGNGHAICTPASGSIFKVGVTTVTCTAVDAHGNTAKPVKFTVTVDFSRHIGPNTLANTNASLIPITGANLFDIKCPPDSFTQKSADYSVTFNNLCNDFQGVVETVDNNGLPASLPNSQSPLTSLYVDVVQNGEIASPLPKGGTITVNFVLPKGTSANDVTIFVWDGSKWSELQGTASKDGYQTTVANGGLFVLVHK